MTEQFNKSPAMVNKSGDNKKRKRKMVAFKIDEVSSVIAGAQEGALAVLMKRAPEEELIEKVMLLTSMDDRHQHGMFIGLRTLEEGGGHTDFSSGALSSPDGQPHAPDHNHAFVINPDGSVTIAAAHGHTHEVVMGEFMGRLRLQTALAVSELADNDPVLVIATKSEDGKMFKAQDYALVLDPQLPSTWKYPLVKSSGGEVHPRRVGAAVKAIETNRIPRKELDTFVRRVRSAWKSCHKDHSQMPSVLKRVANL